MRKTWVVCGLMVVLSGLVPMSAAAFWGTDAVTITKFDAAPNVADGAALDAVWDQAPWILCSDLIYSDAAPASTDDFSAQFKIGYYGHSVYMYIDITDDEDDTSDHTNAWEYDCVEVFMDITHREGTIAGGAEHAENWRTYGGPAQMRFRWNGAAQQFYTTEPITPDDVAYVTNNDTAGKTFYELEFKAPDSINLEDYPSSGFCVWAADDDGGTPFSNRVAWHGGPQQPLGQYNANTEPIPYPYDDASTMAEANIEGPAEGEGEGEGEWDYTAPRLDAAPVMDGTVTAGEYGGQAGLILTNARIDAYGGRQGTADDDVDLSGVFYLGWDDTYFYCGAVITDDDVVYLANQGELTNITDGIQFCTDHQFLRSGTVPTDDGLLIHDVVPGQRDDHDTPAYHQHWPTSNPPDFPNRVIAGRTVAGGYEVEMALLWTDFLPNPPSPQIGMQMGYVALIMEYETGSTARVDLWYGSPESPWPPGTIAGWPVLTLGGAPAEGEGEGEGECEYTTLFADQGPILADLLAATYPELPALWEDWDIEGFEDYVAWVDAGSVGDPPTVGDGLPDAAQMGMLAYILCLDGGAKGIPDGLPAVVQAIYADNLAAIEAEYNGTAFEVVTDLMAGLLGLSPEMRDTYTTLLGVTGSYQVFQWQGGKVMGPYEPFFGADGDLDQDGDSNLDEWLNADGDVDAFLAAVVDPWSASGVPVAGLLGLGLLAGASVLGGALVIRRRK